MSKLRVLEMFAGIAGFSVGLEKTGGFETVGFIERDAYCQRVLAKNFPGVPIADDVTTYEFQEGEADVITAGFPCQDLSFAGSGAGLAGARSGLYREVIRAVRVVRPKRAVLENVAALLSRGLGTVLGDLAEIGYDAEWHCIPASAVGAPHRRDRIWIVANPGGEQHEGDCAPLSGALATQLPIANARNTGTQVGDGQQADAQHPDTDCIRPYRTPFDFVGSGEPGDEQKRELGQVGKVLADASCKRPSVAWPVTHGADRQQGGRMPTASGWWATEPDVGRVAHGVPSRVDRLRSLGNAVVPQVVELIGHAILQSLSAAAPVPSLVGTGARGLLPAVAPVPYVSPEERVDA